MLRDVWCSCSVDCRKQNGPRPVYLAYASRLTFVVAQHAMLVASDVVCLDFRTVVVVSKMLYSQLNTTTETTQLDFM